METFLWCLLATVGWFGFLALFFWVCWHLKGDLSYAKECPTCNGKGYIIDKPIEETECQKG